MANPEKKAKWQEIANNSHAFVKLLVLSLRYLLQPRL
jgi:hypothetical protein